jgi:amino acid adenylation domain-containing protein
VGVDDDFFELGGHSLTATRAISHMHRAFGVQVPVRALFEERTPALLARLVDSTRREARESAERPIPPILPVERDGELPLSFAQQRLWFIHQLDPGSPSYNMARAMRLAGRLHPAGLAAALSEVVRRHEVLRTTFPMVDGHPALSTVPPQPFPLPCIDLSDLPASPREIEAARLAQEEARRPFDLAHGPLLRTSLVREGAEDHTLLVTMHHIVSDGWSIGVLVREITALYRAALAGQPSPLPELPLQYVDYACWQRAWLSGEVLEEQLAYWRQQLAGLPEDLGLPFDRPRPALPNLAGALRTWDFPEELRAAVHRLGRERGATFFMVTLAVFATFLSRITGQTDVVTGSPTANRKLPEIEGLIGFFVNTLVLRINAADTAGPPTFAGLLERVREVALDAGVHEDLPFERLVDELAPERNLVRTPLFQVMFVVQNAPFQAPELPGLTLQALPGDTRTAKFDLTLTLSEIGGVLQASLEYRTALFDESTIDRFIGHLLTLTGAVVADPGAPISRLPLLTAAESRQLVAEALAGVRPFPAGVPLHRLFERQAERTPAAVAVVEEGRPLTYAELDGRANRLAARLRRLGVGPEVRVALWLDRTAELVVAILGVLKAGGAYVPVDPTYPEDRLRFLLEDAGAPVLVSVEELRSRLDLDGVATVLLDQPDEDGAPLPVLSTPPVTDLPDSTAYVIYTSGSTGKPKGVPVSHANVARLLTATDEWFGFNESDVWTLFHSYAFDFSVWELWGALLYGGRLVVVPYWVSRSPEAFYDLLVRERVTVLNQTPSAFHQLAAAGEQRGGRGELVLRWVIFGGEALEPRRLGGWFARHGDRQPTLVNMYGITETTVHVTFRPLARTDLESGSVIGVPIPDLYLHVLDGEREPVPPGVPGEIHVGGAGLARGYLGRPELTAERFVPDPFAPSPGARLYASGDLARRRPDGELEYLGRADQQVKIRGFRIELGEIEAALSQHPAVREVVTLARDGQDGRYLVAWLGVGDGPAPGVDELRGFLKTRLPEHMIPAVFVPLDTLPLTAHGKVDRRALPEPAAVRPALEAHYVAPRTSGEAAMAAVWAEVLGVDRVGVDDNFFALGGDSIRSIRVLALAEQRGLRFSLPQLFQHQTIAELLPHRLASSKRVSAAFAAVPFALATAAERAALPEDVEDAYPLSALQLGMLFHSNFGEKVGESALYHNVASVRLSHSLDATALQAAAAKLAGRHPVLRTSLNLGGFSRPLQLVHRKVDVPVTEEDLAGLGPEETEAAIARRFAEEKSHLFSWDEPPLLRFHLQHLTGGETQFFWSDHHVILDGWSVALMLAELFQLYRAELDGTPPSPAPAATFREFIALEREVLESEEARGFWADLLRDAEPARLLPWHPEEADKDRALINLVLPETVGAGLSKLSAAAGVPLKHVLLAAHVWVVGRITGTRDVLTGLVTNGRPEAADADRILGLFLNTVPLRATLAGGTWIDLARQMFAVEREILPFRRYPMAEIQRELGAAGTTGAGPIFETSFNYVDFYVVEEAGQASGLKLDSLRFFGETNFPLAVSFSPDAVRGTVRMSAQRDPARVNQPQLRAILDLYLRALAAMSETPVERYDTADLLSPPERQEILREWNDTARVSPLPSELVHGVFEHWVAAEPAAAALRWSRGELSYRELNRQANHIARRLRSAGAGPEVAVGLYVERSPEMIAGILGIWKAGATYVPLDPAYPRERLLTMIEDVQMPLALARERLAGGLDGLVGQVIAFDGLEPTGPEDDANPRSRVLSDNLAYVIFTSGSTGRPKPVGVPHRGLTHHAEATRQLLRLWEYGDARVLHFSTLNFDGSLDQLTMGLLNGCCLVLREEEMWSAEELEQRIAEHNLTLVDLSTGYWSEWVRARSAMPEREGGEPVRLVYLGGEAMMSEELAVWWKSPRNRDVRLLNAYGPTETVIVVSALEVTSPESAGAMFERVPIGRPMAERALHVVDEDWRLAPVGVAGELLIAGEHTLARGYLGRPDLTAERFLPDPFSTVPGARLYRTGDLGRYLPDGRREFLGRIDDQVKIRGFRIELGEVEGALMEHPSIYRAVAVVHGKGRNPRLVAYCTPVSEQTERPTAAELRAFLHGKLPEPMVPSDVLVLDHLPLTPSGKVDRRALPAPDLWARRSAGPVHAPRTDLELQLVGIWEELLEVSPIGVTDDFLDLGGHSLLAVRLMARIEHVFGVKLPIAALFEAPTVEQLAGLLQRGEAPARRSPLVRLHAGGAGRPLYVVHPVGGDVFAYVELARKLGPERPVYGLQAVAETDGHPPTMEDLAAQYLAAVREIQPEGPYLLAGWSLGAVIAYEMAQQIERSGGTVALLAMIDPSSPEPSAGIDETALLAGFAADLVRLSGRQVSFGQEVLEGLDVDEALDRLVELGRSEGVLPPDLDRSQLRERFDLFGRHLKALQGYAPRPYEGEAVLFRASGSLAPGATDPTLGWSALTRAEVHLLDADHYSMLQRPILDRLVEQLRSHLKRVEVEEGEEVLAASRRVMAVLP